MATVRKIAASFLALLIVFVVVVPVYGAMSSTNYQILWDTAGMGGDTTSSSSSYNLHDSLEIVGGSATSTSYQLDNGYRPAVYERTVNFRVLGMERSYQVGATALSGTTVTVTTTSSYSSGSYIIVIQDEGASQVSAMGRVTSLTSTTLTVDAWTTNGTTPTIDGTNDVVYLMTTAPSLDFGTLSASSVATLVLGWEATADVSQGYSVYVMADHALRSTVSSTTEISGVSDGTVTAGSTEYGARSSDTSLSLSTFDTQDTALTTSLQQIASRSDNSFESRDFLTLKAAIASGTTSAQYTQTLSVIFVGDY